MDNNIITNIIHLLIYCLTVYTTAALPLVDEYNYTQLFNDADVNAVPQINVQPKEDTNVFNNLDSLRYILYTRRNKYVPQTLVLNDVNSILSSNFNAQRPTVIIAHGWLSNQHTEPNRMLRSVYLDKSDVNVISVDWRELAHASYATAVRGIPDVGHRIGQFLIFLNQVTGASYSTMHFIGFSLGAHVVGNAGRALGGRAARITGLDPAGPSWETNRNRLSPADGIYVEAIHTDGGPSGMGIRTAIADVDFFPNGGVSQPGCSTSVCRHFRAWQFFAATVTYNHLQGRLCTSTSQITTDTCRGPTLNMGNDNLNKRGSGMYRVNRYPCARYPY